MGGSKHGELPASFARSTSAAVAGVTVPTSVTCTPTMDPLAAQPSPERCQPAGFHRPPRPEGVASAAAGNCPGGEKNPAGHGRRPRPGTGPCGRPAPEEAGKAGPAGEDRRRGHRGSVAPTAARRGLPPLPVPLKLENHTPPSDRASRPTPQQKSRRAAAAGSREEGERRAPRGATARPGRKPPVSSVPAHLSGRRGKTLHRSDVPFHLRFAAPHRAARLDPRARQASTEAQQSPFPLAQRLRASDAAPSPAEERAAPRACCVSAMRLAHGGGRLTAHIRLRTAHSVPHAALTDVRQAPSGPVPAGPGSDSLCCQRVGSAGVGNKCLSAAIG